MNTLSAFFSTRTMQITSDIMMRLKTISQENYVALLDHIWIKLLSFVIITIVSEVLIHIIFTVPVIIDKTSIKKFTRKF